MSTDGGSDGDEVLVRPPAHPVPQLQGPFEESMVESVNEMSDHEVPADAVTRRLMLLDSPHYQRIIAGRWKQKPGENYHPLWKLIAQMSFGMHLLVRSMAKSEDEVMKILQSHVDDIDGFLERTTEDFDLAKSDVYERLRCLKLPLAHGDVFDRMLEDRAFRASILEGNEKIEHIVHRTRKATRDSLKDVQKGFDATNLLEKYLATLNKTWKRQTPEHEAVFVAMLGNVEGWRKAFLELHLQGNKLVGSLKKLSEVVSEMQRRAATVARRILAQSQIINRPPARTTPPPTSRSSLKPLPAAPDQRPSRKPSSQLLSNTGRPSSALKPTHDPTSEASVKAETAIQPSKQKKNDDTKGRRSFLPSFKSSPDSTPGHSMTDARSKGKAQDPVKPLPPVELPADVPKDVMQQAPVSIKNRLSMTLGLQPKDKSEYRISSIYYPKALGDLLKIPASPQLMLTPQFATARNTAIRSITPNSARSEAETDYFSAYEKSPSVGVIVSDSPILKPFSSQQQTPPTSSSTAEEANDRPRSSARSPAFTSHPSVLLMAQPPSEMPNVNEPVSGRRKTHLKEASRSSSLGEPGPSILEADLESSTSSSSTTETDRRQEEKGFKIPEIIEPSMTSLTLQSIPERTSLKLHDSSMNLEESVLRAMEHAQSEQNTTSEKTNAVITGAIKSRTPDAETSDATQVTVVELEGISSSDGRTLEFPDPVELEVPQPHFVLPPRPTEIPQEDIPVAPAINPKTNRESSSHQIRRNIRQGLKGRRSTDSLVPQPIKPLKLRLTRQDGKMISVPVHNAAAEDGEQRMSHVARVSTGDLIASILGTISNTSSSAENRQRSASDSSPHSPRLLMSQRSKSLGSPEPAATSPALSGRTAVRIDSAGQFEGEHQKPKRVSSGSASTSGWKSLLGGPATTFGSSPSAGTMTTPSMSPRDNLAVQQSSKRGSGTDLMTPAGNDVLWFKEGLNATPSTVGTSS